ncbi:hypothetical protein LBMAG27_20920 [Bacteroidota bacterium]|nr:hypothetical protein LBMAG27_20920 [Bacteroidota bacterium]
MKQKFFKAAAVLVILLLSFSMSNQVSAQSSENTNKQTQTTDGTKYQFMQTPAGGNGGAFKTESGQSVVDENGNVTVTTIVPGQESVVSVVIKPVINTSVEIGTDMDQYITNYVKWMKVNPVFEKFMTADELAYANEGNYEAAYKTNYYNAQQKAIRQSLDNK